MAASKESKEPNKGKGGVTNRRARFDYEFLETVETGIALVGTEVKSVWLGRANMTDSYCQVKNGELWLFGLDIEPYDHASHFQHERRRDRKLLAHRREIDILERKIQEKGLSLIPLKLYFAHGKVKVEVGLGRGKREYDKRQKIAEREERSDTDRVKREFR